MATLKHWDKLASLMKHKSLTGAEYHLGQAIKDIRKLKKQVEAQQTFIDNVVPEDRLYVSSYGVWRRKEVSKDGIFWVRANMPDALVPKEPHGPPDTIAGADLHDPAASGVVRTPAPGY